MLLLAHHAFFPLPHVGVKLCLRLGLFRLLLRHHGFEEITLPHHRFVCDLLQGCLASSSLLVQHLRILLSQLNVPQPFALLLSQLLGLHPVGLFHDLKLLAVLFLFTPLGLFQRLSSFAAEPFHSRLLFFSLCAFGLSQLAVTNFGVQESLPTQLLDLPVALLLLFMLELLVFCTLLLELRRVLKHFFLLLAPAFSELLLLGV